MQTNLKTLLVNANHILANEGVVDGLGHISVRNPKNPSNFFLSRSCSPELVEISDIMEFGPNGEPANPDERKPYLERYIHAAIFAQRADVHSVVHNHSHDLIPFGVTDTQIRPLIHVASSIGTAVPIWDIRDKFGDTSLLVKNMDHAQDLASCLGRKTAALMRGHGAVVVGDSIEAAVLTSIYLQINARLDLAARQLGPVKYLSKGEIACGEEALLSGSPKQRVWDYFMHKAMKARS